MKFSYTFAIAVGLAVVTLSGCDAVGTNDSSTLPDINVAPQIEISKQIPTNVKTLPSDASTMYRAVGDTTGNG